MTTLKRNIMIAKITCTLSLFFFIFFQFSSEELLFSIGCKIEKVLHISTNINVKTMQSFLTAILSGVFASTLVALVFYYQEYKRAKENLILKIMDEIDKIVVLYNKIPFFDYFCDTEFNRKALEYYKEYYNNKCCEEMKEVINGGIKKINKGERRSVKRASEKEFSKIISEDRKNELLSYIHQNENVLISLGGEKITPDEKLEEIRNTIDLKIKQAADAYNAILEYDIDSIIWIIMDVCDNKRYSSKKKKMIKKQMKDSNIIIPAIDISYSELVQKGCKLLRNKEQKNISKRMNFNSKYVLSTKCIVERVGEIVKRSQTYIKATFEMKSFDAGNNYDKNNTLVILSIFQSIFFDKTEINIGEETMSIPYCKQSYVLDNLRQLLLFDISGYYTFMEKYKYTKINDRYEGNRHVKWSIHNGQELNPNIFRL